MQMRFLLFSFLFLLSLFSCKKAEDRSCVKSNGNLVVVERSLGAFSKLELYDNINLFIVPDTTNYLILEVPENLEKFISTEIANNALVIKNENNCNWLRSFDFDINIRLHTHTLNRIDYRGSGTVKNAVLYEKDNFEIHVFDGSNIIELGLVSENVSVKIHNGPADIFLRGKAVKADVYNAGEGFVFMQNFNTEITEIRHRGTGDCHVNASERMSVILEYVGSVHCYGNPSEFTTLKTGSGEIILH